MRRHVWMFHLCNDDITDSFAVSFHGEDVSVVSFGDVEHDVGAASVGLVCVRGFDGQHRAAHLSVLRQTVVPVLHTENTLSENMIQTTPPGLNNDRCTHVVLLKLGLLVVHADNLDDHLADGAQFWVQGFI